MQENWLEMRSHGDTNRDEKWDRQLFSAEK